MKSPTRCSSHTLMAVLTGTMFVAGAVLFGCSSAPEKSGGPKKGKQEQKTEEPATQPQEPAAKPEEPVPPPEPTTKPAEPITKPEESLPTPEPPAKPTEPAAMPEQPVPPPQPPAKPEPSAPPEPAEKPAEPGTKSAEPATKAESPGGAPAAGMPPAPKASTFAPAEDLVNQVGAYLKSLQAAVESEQEYNDSKENIVKQANTLIIIALALGMHDQENKVKSNAGAVMKAAQDLADAKDFAAAKKGVEAVQAAAAGPGSGAGELKWEKVAALDQLMKQVPVVNTKLKRFAQAKYLKKRAKDTAGYAAVIAAIAQASIADTHVAKNPEEVQKWYQFCTEMRDTAGAVNAGIHAGDPAATDAGMAKLAQGCDDCHKVFHPAALGKTDVEEKEK